MALTDGNIQLIRTDTNQVFATIGLNPDGTFSTINSVLTGAPTTGIPVIARYLGVPGQFASSDSPAVNDVVTDPTTATVTTLVISPNPVAVGGTQTFSGTVTPQS